VFSALAEKAVARGFHGPWGRSGQGEDERKSVTGRELQSNTLNPAEWGEKGGKGGLSLGQSSANERKRKGGSSENSALGKKKNCEEKIEEKRVPNAKRGGGGVQDFGVVGIG